MKISISPYTLGKRNGALLRINDGYCDCHPWPELGDKPLKEQLSLLKQGITTPLTERSLHFAKIDAQARSENRNLFQDLEMPLSHYLMNTSEIPEGFTTIKVKSEIDFSKIPKNIKVRLDFNNRLTYESFSKYHDSILEYKDQIDFIEDPFPYSEKWKEFSIPLATDFQPIKGPIAIYKPAVESHESFSYCKRVIITSYLDHPLGQLAAAYTASGTKEVCGLLSHLYYEKNAFSERISNKGPLLIPPTEGTGFGFDDLLQKLPWSPL